MQNDLNNENHKKLLSSIDSLEDFIVYLKNISNKELNLMVKKLNHLCDHFDPFDPFNLDNESENILKEYNLERLTSNPYIYTSYLLRMIDATEQMIKQKQNYKRN